MKIKIINTSDGKFIAKMRWLCFWIQISEHEFYNKNACLNWVTNGSRLGEVWDFENETLKLLLNLNRCTNVK